MSVKRDLCKAVDSEAMRDGAELPSALRMYEIEQNDSTHPYINHFPYAPPRQAHTLQKKTYS